ncbi:hypothetical protein QAD02_006047 [Eretmocerus hayati]|uniref:Uncharacterized protein n=1 Tax=Eretmocerus hayati TaxID=131215 RepID=A0ACC2MZY0_9HYME|nr:hypothetical protein QAD02_006047 [Eretmocerus hayati]
MIHRAIFRGFLVVIVVTSVLSDASIQTVFQWRYFDFVWPSESAKQQAVRDGSYNLSQVIPSDIDIAKDGRVFISFVFFRGTPARFGVVSKFQDVSGHLIQPYPSWKWFNGSGCDDTILSLIRFKILHEDLCKIPFYSEDLSPGSPVK